MYGGPVSANLFVFCIERDKEYRVLDAGVQGWVDVEVGDRRRPWHSWPLGAAWCIYADLSRARDKKFAAWYVHYYDNIIHYSGK